MPHQSVRVGILGVGQRGLQHLGVLWALQSEGQFRITALCDAWAENLTDAKIQQFIPDYDSNNISTFTSFEIMMAEDLLDILYICLPPGVHNGEVIAAAQAGIHVFVEKPMSLYYDEALEMEQAIQASNVISTVGFQQRYDSLNETVQNYLLDRRVVMLSSVSHGILESHSVKHTHTEELGGPSNRVWTANFEWSGSAIVEAGIHTVDLMRYWCGDIDWVQAAYVPRAASDIENDGDNPYACIATLGFQKGAVGTLHMTKLRRVFHSMGEQVILWDHGHLKFEQEGPVAYYYEGMYPPEAPPTEAQLRHPVPVPPRNNALEEINKTFIDAVVRNNPGLLRSTFSSAMNSLAAVLAANASHDLKGERIYMDQFVQDPHYLPFRRKTIK